MSVAQFGNTAALDRGQLLPGNRVTTFQFLGDDTLQEKVRTVVHEDGVWARISLAPPAWVESDDPALATAFSVFYGIPVGRPDGEDWL